MNRNNKCKNKFALFFLLIITVSIVTETQAIIEFINVQPTNPSTIDSVIIIEDGYLTDSYWEFENYSIERVDSIFTMNIHALDSWQPGIIYLPIIIPYSIQEPVVVLKAGSYMINVTELHQSLRSPIPDFKTITFNVSNAQKFDINGRVMFCPTGDPVNNVTKAFYGEGLQNRFANDNGEYLFENLTGGLEYIVKPSKINNTGSSISANDANWILQYGVGSRTFSPYKMFAGDVNGNCAVSVFESTKILQYDIGVINEFPVMEDTSHLWRFSIIAGISQETVNQYGGFQSTKVLVLQQFQTINTRFNQPQVFNGTFEFAVDSIYQFTGNPVNEIFVTHPNFDYRVVYDAFPNQGGGWYGPPYNAIHHAWAWNFFGGTFGSYATDGMVHEFGHARGAIDLNAIQVSAAKNPVNGQAYIEAKSIMNYPYGETVWDLHSINLINRNAEVVYTNANYISSAFPSSIGIKVFDSNGQYVPNADLEVYPINWYTDSVIATPLYILKTNAQGEYVFLSNPFCPFSAGYPWEIKYPNFLVIAKMNGSENYKFMPLTTVQNSYFANPEVPYRLIFGDSTTTLTVISPNGAENWSVGSSQNINWTSEGSIDSVTIEYSIDNGNNWSMIIESTPDDKSYSWIIPNTPSYNCLAKISDATDGYPWDMSDALFSISLPTVLGDANGDKAANSTDALIVLSCDVGINVSQFCPMNCGDVNGDGLINSTDALIILSYDVGISVPFPVGQPGCPSNVTQCPGCP